MVQLNKYKNYIIDRIVTMLAIFVVTYLLLGLTGCADPKVVYKDKLVPTKCEVKLPNCPQETNDIMVDIPNIFIYSQVLGEDALACVGDNTLED